MRNFGYIESQLEPEAYILGRVGGVPSEILQPDSDWTPFLPKEEDQNLWGIETFNCTSYNTLNQIEIYMKRKFGGEYNYSDRFVGIMAGTKPPGNDPQRVYESIRKYGLIPDEMLPFTEDIKNTNEYYSWKGGDKEACLKAGREWLAQYNFSHEWVAANEGATEGMIKTALQFSPLTAAVYAWSSDGQKYVRAGQDNHWTVAIYSIKDFYKCDDSYDPNNKNLDKGFGFKWVKRIYIEKNTTPLQLDIIGRIIALIQKILPFLFKSTPVLPPKTPLDEPKPPEPINIPPTPPKPPARPDWKKWYIGQGWKEYAEEGKREACKMAKQKCIEAGFPEWLTNELLSTLQGESGYNVFCVNENKVNGKVASTDFGIAQLNDFYYLKPYNMTGEDALNNPERCVDVMLSAFKAGRSDDWIAHRGGNWKHHQNYPDV